MYIEGPHLGTTIKMKYEGLLWALPAPQTILAIGLNWELSHMVGNYKDPQRLSFQVSVLEFHKMQNL